MRARTVKDVMTRDVVSIGPDTPYQDIVDRMITDGIGAVPVVAADGTLLGVVSETDLLAKEEHADDPAGAGPGVFAGPRTRRQWRKAAGLTARELMTSPARTVHAAAYLPAAARQLAEADVRRLLVVDDGRLVGVLSRRDLLRGFLRGDNEIREEVEREVFGQLWVDPAMVRASVEHGVVLLTGRVEYEADVAIATGLAKAIPGVVAVRNRLTYFWNGEGPREHTPEQRTEPGQA